MMTNGYDLLLLLLSITATTTNSSRRSHPPIEHREAGGTTNSSIKAQSTTRYQAKWETGFLPDEDIHNKRKPLSSSLHQKWEGSSGSPVSDCPKGCECTFRKEDSPWVGGDLCVPSTYQWLKVLNCISDPLKELPKLLISHRNIARLTLENCHLSRLPQCILDLHSLTDLHIIKNEIRELPSQLQKLTALKCLQIVQNKGYFRLENMANLTSLSWLDLSQNKLAALPLGIENMTSLIRLDLHQNELPALPEGILALTNLNTLDLSYNKLDSLPCVLGNLSNLVQIYLSNNRIHINDTGKTKLPKLDLKGKKKQPLLPGRNNMTYVSRNNLLEFRDSCKRINDGKIFQLQHNKIKYFKDVFDCWKMAVNPIERLHTLLANTHIDLVGNPLVCDCVDYDVYRYLQTLECSPWYKILTCHEPLSLSGQNPRNIKLENFVCIVELNCPNGCTCTKVPHTQTINVTCGSYYQPDIPEIVPDLPDDSYKYHLDFCNQGLGEITRRSYLQKASAIRLSNNSIVSIKFEYPCAFQTVKILHLDNNLLQRLPASVRAMTNDTTTEIRLGNNPWVCDCKAIDMKKWIVQNSQIVKDKDNILCDSPRRMHRKKVIDIDKAMVCQTVDVNMTAVYIVVAISSVVIICMVCLTFAENLKSVYRRLIGSDECDGEGKEFDVFMCSADHRDSDYVENFLIPELERRDFRVLYHREHFQPGKPITVNMSEAIEKSKRTLVLFSNSFRESNFCIHEFNEAYYLDVENKTRRLITIKDTDLDMTKLDIHQRNYFLTHTYLEREDPKFWKLLEGVLPKKRLGAQVR